MIRDHFFHGESVPGVISLVKGLKLVALDGRRGLTETAMSASANFKQVRVPVAIVV